MGASNKSRSNYDSVMAMGTESILLRFWELPAVPSDSVSVMAGKPSSEAVMVFEEAIFLDIFGLSSSSDQS